MFVLCGFAMAMACSAWLTTAAALSAMEICIFINSAFVVVRWFPRGFSFVPKVCINLLPETAYQELVLRRGFNERRLVCLSELSYAYSYIEFMQAFNNIVRNWCCINLIRHNGLYLFMWKEVDWLGLEVFRIVEFL